MRISLIVLFLLTACSSEPKISDSALSLSDYQKLEKKDKDKWKAQQQDWSTKSREANKNIKSKSQSHSKGIMAATAPRHKISKEQLKYISTLAQKGDPDAQCQLGLFYKYGMGLKANQTQAYKWLKKAADQDHSKAKRILLHMNR